MAVRIDKFYQGQQASKYFAGVADTENVDVFDEQGSFKCSDGFSEYVPSSKFGGDGTLFCVIPYSPLLFLVFNAGSTGQKGYMYNTSTEVSTEITGMPSSDVVSSLYFGTTAYFCTKIAVYKVTISGSTASASLVTGSSSATHYVRPMLVHGLDLYIGTGKDISSVDSSGVFTLSALDLPASFEVQDIVSYGDDLLIGGYVTRSDTGFVVRYDTYSESFYAKDLLKEKVLSLLNSTDNNIIFAITNSKFIYYYNGNTLDIYKTLPVAVYSSTHNHKTECNGKNLARIMIKGSVVKTIGLGRQLIRETFGLYTDIADINSASAYNSYTQIITYAGDTYIIYSGSIYRRQSQADKLNCTLLTSMLHGRTDSIKVGYQTLPTSTDIKIYTRIDGTTTWTEQTSVNNTLTQQKETSNVINNSVPIQVKVELIPNNADTPVITYIDII